MKVKIRNTAADATRVLHAGAILVVENVAVLEGLDYDILEPIQATTTDLTPEAKAAAAAAGDPTLEEFEAMAEANEQLDAPSKASTVKGRKAKDDGK